MHTLTDNDIKHQVYLPFGRGSWSDPDGKKIYFTLVLDIADSEVLPILRKHRNSTGKLHMLAVCCYNRYNGERIVPIYKMQYANDYYLEFFAPENINPYEIGGTHTNTLSLQLRNKVLIAGLKAGNPESTLRKVAISTLKAIMNKVDPSQFILPLSSDSSPVMVHSSLPRCMVVITVFLIFVSLTMIYLC